MQSLLEAKKMPGATYTSFFRLTSRLLKYFFIALFSFSITLILSYSLGITQIATLLLSEVVPWLIRSAIIVGCMMISATIVESLRS
jgi:hypothetical protein